MGNDGIISCGNENAVVRGGIFECGGKGPEVTQYRSHGLMRLATVLTCALIASWDINVFL